MCFKISIFYRSKESINRIDRELLRAARVNNLREVRRLVSVGADVNVKDSHSASTPLHYASLWGHVQVVKELRDHGADIEAKDNFGTTPLHSACFAGHLAVVNELLVSGRGANILAADNQEQLPIHYAVNNRRSEVVKCLLQHFYAKTLRFPLHDLVEDLTWIGFLTNLNHTIDVFGNPNHNIDTPPLRTALHYKVLGTHDVVEILEYLVGQNPELLSSRDQDGSLPLHVACRRGTSFTIVQSLVNPYKASVKSVTPQGDLPLFLACEKSETSLETIFLLMKLYPDVVYR
jgi:ankyrin repeat protein